MRESNSHQRFWRPLSYHLTNPLQSIFYILSKLHTCQHSLRINFLRCRLSIVIYSTPRGSLRDFVTQCHLLRKCPVCIRNASPQASLLRILPAPSCPLPRLVGQALTRLVTVSSMCCHTSTSALSTSSSSRGFTSFEWDISS